MHLLLRYCTESNCWLDLILLIVIERSLLYQLICHYSFMHKLGVVSRKCGANVQSVTSVGLGLPGFKLPQNTPLMTPFFYLNSLN